MIGSLALLVAILAALAFPQSTGAERCGDRDHRAVAIVCVRR